MINIAGVRTEAADHHCRSELEAAGIAVVVREVPRADEVGTHIEGRLDMPGHGLTMDRAWCYWRIHITPALPHALADRINGAPSPHNINGRLGSVVRAYGHAGGKDPERSRPVDNYHVDTVEGLLALVRILTGTAAP